MKAEILSFKLRPDSLWGPPALKPRAPFPRVRQAEGTDYYSARFSAVSEIAWSYFLTSYYFLNAWCLNNHMGLPQVSVFFEALGMNLCYLKKISF
jgi:hypothetical protein